MIARSVKRLGSGLYDRVLFPIGAQNSIHYRVQNIFEVLPTSCGYFRLFSRDWSGRAVKLTTRLHSMPQLRMREAIPEGGNRIQSPKHCVLNKKQDDE
jgi:hypothetical protein